MKTYLKIMFYLILISTYLPGTFVCAQEQGSSLYPQTNALKHGFLDVSSIHKLYWEVHGNEDGLPVIVLHGGPGGAALPNTARFFDPDKYKIILFDQRGGGRSLPKAEWRDNNINLMVEDIDKIRDHLGVKGKAMLFGGSWGTTLAIAYAETYPELVCGMVLRGVFLGTKAEKDHYWHGGTSLFFPKRYEEFKKLMPEPDTMDYPRQIFEMTQSDDPEIRDKAVRGAIKYGFGMISMDATDDDINNLLDNYYDELAVMIVIDSFYSMNDYFLEKGQLLSNTGKIAHIPTFIVNGRFDLICPPKYAINLADRLENARLEIVVAAHGQSETAITEALVNGVKWVYEQISNK